MKYFNEWNSENSNSESAASYIASVWYDNQEYNHTSYSMIQVIKSVLPIMWKMPGDVDFLPKEAEDAIFFIRMAVDLHMPMDKEQAIEVTQELNKYSDEDRIVCSAQLCAKTDLLKQSIALYLLSIFGKNGMTNEQYAPIILFVRLWLENRNYENTQYSPFTKFLELLWRNM